MKPVVHAVAAGIRVGCPHCRGSRFHQKRRTLPGRLLQAFDMEAFGEQSIMLICVDCGRVQEFADRGQLTIREGSPE